MLVCANTPALKATARSILLKEIGVKATQDFQALMWVDEETSEIEWVIGFDGFIGKVCQIHDVNLGGKITPRALLKASFDYPFNQCGVETLIGIVNSNNKRAMAYNRKLGFTEFSRLVGKHDDGGDLVMFTMVRSQCKWIKEFKHEKLLVTQAA